MNERVYGAGGVVPVKIVLERRIRPGARQAFEHWLRELMSQASRSSALRGSSVLTAGEEDCFILLCFESQAEYERWRGSAEVAELLRQGDAHAVDPGIHHVRSGLETWFTLPGKPVPRRPPPRWKMALVTWLALLPQALLMGALVPGWIPVLGRVALSTAVPVAMLTWVLMPRLTMLLSGWLYGPPEISSA